MNKIAIIGTALLTLGLGMGMSGNAQAYAAPPIACTGANEGSLYFTQIGPFRPGQAYKIIQWECYSNQWFITEQFYCDYYGAGCIQM